MTDEQQVLFGAEAPQFFNFDVELRFIDGIMEWPVEADFVASVRDTYGVIIPVGLRPHGEPGRQRYSIIWGRRRIRTHQIIGLTKIPARVLETPEWGNDAILSFIENEQRSDNIPVALDKLEELVKEGWDVDKIASYARVKPRIIHKYLSLAALTPALRNLFNTGAMSTALAYRASKLARENQVALFQFINATKRTAAEVNAQITILLRPDEQDSLFAIEELRVKFDNSVKAVRQVAELWGLPSDAAQSFVERITAVRNERLRRIEEEKQLPAEPAAGGGEPENQGVEATPVDENAEPVGIAGGPTQILETYDEDNVPL